MPPVPAISIRSDRLVSKLQYRIREAHKDDGYSAVVAYTTHYAVRVHEDLQMPHPRGGEAKYLEKPARTKRKEISAAVVAAKKAGKRMPQALLAGAELLLGFSRAIVPVDTGLLRNTSVARLVRK